MSLKECVYSMLIVSSSSTLNSALKSLFDERIYSPVHIVSSISAAKLAMNEREYDFLIINSPLHDEQGINYAIDLCASSDVIVLLIVSNEIHDEIYNKVSPYGVYTLPKPTSRSILERALAWMISGRERVRQVHPVFINQIVQLAHEAQRLRVTFKVVEVSLHLRSKPFSQRLPFELEPSHVIFEPLSDTALTEMSERRVPDIVKQSCALQYITYVSLILRPECFIFYFPENLFRHILSQ